MHGLLRLLLLAGKYQHSRGGTLPTCRHHTADAREARGFLEHIDQPISLIIRSAMPVANRPEHAIFTRPVHKVLRSARRDIQPLGHICGAHNRLHRQKRGQAVDARPFALGESLRPLLHNRVNPHRNEPAYNERKLKGIDELLDNRDGIPLLIDSERFHVRIDVMQKTSRDGKRNARQNAGTTKHLMEQGAARTAISIDKRMDGLELRMDDGRLCNGIDIIAIGKGDDIGQILLNPRPCRWNVLRTVRTVRRAANPDLLLAELPTK